MSTISNERLEEIAEEDNGSDVLFESSVLARELLALRKEREQAEPDYIRYDCGCCGHETLYIQRNNICPVCNHIPMSETPLYIAPPAPDERYQQLSELYHAQEKRLFNLAQRIKGPSFDKYSRSPSQAIDVLEAAIFGETDEDGRTAMLHSVMQPCDKCGLTGIHACMGGMETNTTPQQFESLASVKQQSSNLAATGNASRDSDDNSSPDSQTTIKQSDGWIPCSERMPPENTGVLVTTEFDGPGDWRMKWGTRVPGHPDAKNGWFIPGASWTPSHWQPLPEAPCK